MKFDEHGYLITDHSLCLCCQFNKGDPHLCSSCQWARANDWLNQKEAEWRLAHATEVTS